MPGSVSNCVEPEQATSLIHDGTVSESRWIEGGDGEEKHFKREYSYVRESRI